MRETALTVKGHWARLLLLLVPLLLSPARQILAQPAPPTLDPLLRQQCAGVNCAPPQPVVADAGILGGERDVLAQQVAGTGALRIWGSAWPALAVENDPPDGSSAYLLVWDGMDGDPTTIDYEGLGADLLAGCVPGTARFVLHQTSLDRRAAYRLTLYTGEDNASTWSSGVVDQSEAYFQVSPDDLTLTAGTGADLHRLGAISLWVDTTLEATTDLSLAPLTFECDTMPPTPTQPAPTATPTEPPGLPPTATPTPVSPPVTPPGPPPPEPPPLVPEASSFVLLLSAASGLAAYASLQIRTARRERGPRRERHPSRQRSIHGGHPE